MCIIFFLIYISHRVEVDDYHRKWCDVELISDCPRFTRYSGLQWFHVHFMSCEWYGGINLAVPVSHLECLHIV